MKYDVYVCGMRVEKYVGEGPGEESFDMEPCECVREILFCTVPDFSNIKYIITIENHSGWCGSGYTTASFGNMDFKRVYHSFGSASHLPKNHKPILLLNIEYDTEVNDIIELSDSNANEDYSINYGVFTFEDWGDEYYPYSCYSVNYNLFDELPRAIKNRPVWIFYGDSGSGKTTIANYLAETKTIYETDSAPEGELPYEIWADVIVYGNKWKNKFTLEDVKERVIDAEIIEVNFNKSKEEDRNAENLSRIRSGRTGHRS